MGNRATFNVSFDVAKCFDLILATVEGFLLFVCLFFSQQFYFVLIVPYSCMLLFFYLIKGVYLTLDMGYKIFVKKSRLARRKTREVMKQRKPNDTGNGSKTHTASEAFIIARGFLHL